MHHSKEKHNDSSTDDCGHAVDMYHRLQRLGFDTALGALVEVVVATSTRTTRLAQSLGYVPLNRNSILPLLAVWCGCEDC